MTMRHEDAIPSCQVPGCGNVSGWTAIILVWPMNVIKNQTRPIDFEFDSPFCDAHRVTLRRCDYLNPEIRGGIEDWFKQNGHQPPNWHSAEIRFKRMQHAASQQDMVH